MKKKQTAPSNGPRLWYVGLEALEARYTLQLTEWNIREFNRMGVEWGILKGIDLDASKKINVGQVLDAMGRPFYALSQIQEIIVKLKNGDIKKEDTLFFEDMFHPGFEALPYMFNQLGWRPKVFVRCLAQTIDPDDFVHVAKMTEWMRTYEHMVNSCVDAVLMASHEMVAHATVAGWTVPCIVTGLPFGKQEVIERAKQGTPQWPWDTHWHNRSLRVLFAARLDQEKQPDFFIDLANMWRADSDVPVEFVFLSGGKATTNNQKLRKALNLAEKNQVVQVKRNLTKVDYYQYLTSSRVLFNCALQDWVSNTVSEADALGCNVLYPAYRSFPEVFASDHSRLYTPWSVRDAYLKLRRLLLKPHPFMGQISDNQDQTIRRSVEAMQAWGTSKQGKHDAPIIDPRDTSYRHEMSNRDRVTCIHEDFWEIGQVTDKELLKSYKERK